MTVFTFESDPSHGWLLVTYAQLAKAGVSEQDISSHSYVSRNGVIALEEDRDAPLFLNAWSAKTGEAPRFDERNVESTPIRSWTRFGAKPSVNFNKERSHVA